MASKDYVTYPRKTYLMKQLFHQPQTTFLVSYSSAFFWLIVIAFLLSFSWIISHIPENVTIPEFLTEERINRVITSLFDFGYLLAGFLGFILFFLHKKYTFNSIIIEYVPLAVIYIDLVVLAIGVWNLVISYPSFLINIPWFISFPLATGLLTPIFFYKPNSWSFIQKNNILLVKIWYGITNTWIIIYACLLFVFAMNQFKTTTDYSWFWFNFQNIPQTLSIILFFGLFLNSFFGSITYFFLKKKFNNFPIIFFSYLLMILINLLSITVMLWNIFDFGKTLEPFIPWWLCLFLFALTYFPANYQYLRNWISHIFETKRKVEHAKR